MYRKGTTDARVLDAAVQVVRVVRILRMGSAMGNRIAHPGKRMGARSCACAWFRKGRCWSWR